MKMMEDIIYKMIKFFNGTERLTLTISEVKRGRYFVHSTKDDIADGVFSVYKDAQDHLHGLVGHYATMGFNLESDHETEDE